MFLLLPRKTSVRITFLLLSSAALFANAAHGAEALPKCCVWRVTNAKAPFYLVGSIHALSRKDYPLPRPYELALKDAKRLLFEFDPNRGPEFEKKLAAAGKYPPGQNIRSKIDPKFFAWLRENISAVNIEHNRPKKSPGRVAEFDTGVGYKPWWIAQHLVDTRNSSNMSTSHGLDDYLVSGARKMGKEIDGLESVDEHVAVSADCQTVIAKSFCVTPWGVPTLVPTKSIGCAKGGETETPLRSGPGTHARGKRLRQ
jgi:uncharacterized protein YbaP (TraB family)